MRITDNWLKAHWRRGRPSILEVADRDGLSVKVSTTGKVTFVVRYRYDGSRNAKRLAIGSYPRMSLEAARTENVRLRSHLEQGHDPSIVRRLEKHVIAKSPTLESLFRLWYSRYCASPAPFQHRPDRAMSYYVRLETDRGEVEHWGLDLERALRQSLSRPGIGDEVGLRKMGSELVTVRATKRDGEGRDIGQETVSARRNQWSLEKKEFLEERAQMAAVVRDPSVSAAEASRRYPELDGSYVQLQVAQSMVEQRFKSKLHREQFMDHLRGYLAREIEQGQPLEPAPPRTRLATAEPRVHDRDYQPVR